MSAGHGGQVMLTQTTRDLLGEGFELSDLGEHRLKDLSAPQRLFQLGSARFPRLKTLHQTNLPVQPTPLVGRRAELDEVLRLLHGSRLVTLTGAGGSGKTRLALHVAAELVDAFPEGVWWVPLAAIRDAELVEPAIGQVLGAANGLADHLRSQRTLLLLDNFEQVVAAAPAVAGSLAEAPDVRALVTSRERLGLAGEQEYPVPTLAAPEAVELFTARARQLEPGFEADGAVAEICRRLDGLPLALELAAARVKVLSPRQILERLGHSLDLLTTGPRDAPERHRTLRATIEWSYELLDEEERRLFARLAVFAGSFDLEAAEIVAGAELDRVAALVDKSLLRHTVDDRFFLLETVREYASERLRADEDGEATCRRHALHYLCWAEARVPANPLAQLEPSALREFDREHDNLRHALDWLGPNDPKAELRLVVACHRFWIRRNHWQEGDRRTAAALERAGAAEVQLRARATWSAGHFAWRRGDFARAKQLAEHGLAVHLAAGMGGMELARAYNELAIAEHMLGNHARAVELYELVLSLAREEGDEKSEAVVLNNLGNLALERRDLVRARRFFEDGLALDRRRGRRGGMANALVDLGFLALLERDVDDAAARLKEGMRLGIEDDLRETLLWCMDGLAAVSVERGSARAAVSIIAASSRLRDELSIGHYYAVADEVRQRTIAAATSELGETAYRDAWAAGEELSLDEAAVRAAALVD
jgi:predicted ATPase